MQIIQKIKRWWIQISAVLMAGGLIAVGGVGDATTPEERIAAFQQQYFNQHGEYVQLLPNERLPSDAKAPMHAFKQGRSVGLPEGWRIDVHEHPDGKKEYSVVKPRQETATSTSQTLLPSFFSFVNTVLANTHSADFEADNSEWGSITDAAQTGLDITGDFTFEAWVKVESLTDTRDILSKDDSQDRGYLYAVQSTGKLMTFFFDGAGNFDADFSQFQTDNAVISTGTWTHVAVACDVSVPDCTFYVDGSSVASTADFSNANAVRDNSVDFRLGARSVSGGTEERFFDGLMDQVRVWTDIRTAQEISDNACLEVDAGSANLVAYYKLDNDLTDATANNNDLTNNNTVTFSTETALDNADLCAGGAVDSGAPLLIPPF